MDVILENGGELGTEKEVMLRLGNNEWRAERRYERLALTRRRAQKLSGIVRLFQRRESSLQGERF